MATATVTLPLKLLPRPLLRLRLPDPAAIVRCVKLWRHRTRFRLACVSVWSAADVRGSNIPCPSKPERHDDKVYKFDDLKVVCRRDLRDVPE